MLAVQYCARDNSYFFKNPTRWLGTKCTFKNIFSRQIFGRICGVRVLYPCRRSTARWEADVCAHRNCRIMEMAGETFPDTEYYCNTRRPVSLQCRILLKVCFFFSPPCSFSFRPLRSFCVSTRTPSACAVPVFSANGPGKPTAGCGGHNAFSPPLFKKKTDDARARAARREGDVTIFFPGAVTLAPHLSIRLHGDRPPRVPET